MTKDEIIKAVDGQLSGYLWGGHCKCVHKNKWGEWIADCIVYNPDYEHGLAGVRAISEPKPREWQFMVQIKTSSIGELTRLYRAENDKRLPTFIESMGFIDENAPQSPYIIENLNRIEYELLTLF